MNYLCIENNGVCPIQGFDLLGASTARGTGKIGQFGTGAKHAILVLLRNGIAPIVYLGETPVKFSTDDEFMGDKKFERVYYRVGNAERTKTSMSTEFGELDWGKNMDMALREFISNAIDQNDGQAPILNITNKVRGEEGTTRIFVEFNTAVRKYYADIENRFLHFGDGKNADKVFFPNDENNGPAIYRKGVYVKRIGLTYGRAPALFNYNFPDLDIDECRNLEGDRGENRIGREILQNKQLFIAIIRHLNNNGNCWEHDALGSWHFAYYHASKDITKWWKDTFGDLTITASDSVHEFALRKGIPCLRLKEGWVSTLSKCGIPTMDKCVSPLVEKGCVEIPTEDNTQKIFDKVWNTLVEFSLHSNKVKPELKMFEKHQEGQSMIHGYYKDNVVYIHKDYATYHTILHEIGHHITGAEDKTHDFQEFFCKVSAKLLEKHYPI
jgi:hypothetical protein